VTYRSFFGQETVPKLPRFPLRAAIERRDYLLGWLVLIVAEPSGCLP
jgi:hypothetical protein